MSVELAGIRVSSLKFENLLEASYKPGVSPVDAFARMMAKLFEGTGSFSSNPLDPELRKLAEPTLTKLFAKMPIFDRGALPGAARLSEARIPRAGKG